MTTPFFVKVRHYDEGKTYISREYKYRYQAVKHLQQNLVLAHGNNHQAGITDNGNTLKIFRNDDSGIVETTMWISRYVSPADIRLD